MNDMDSLTTEEIRPASILSWGGEAAGQAHVLESLQLRIEGDQLRGGEHVLVAVGLPDHLQAE